MEQDEPTGELYDFLYRDTGRMASYYAQLFSGHLTSVEESDTEINTDERSGKIDAKVLTGENKATRGAQSSSKRVTVPHDIILTDVLAFLRHNEHLSPDISHAPHGSLVITCGTVKFIDSSMGDLIANTLREIFAPSNSTPIPRQGKGKSVPRGNMTEEQRSVLTLFEQLRFPSAFILQSETGPNVVGIIKEDGMEEPIPSYYFRHGKLGLSDVFMIGIKEDPSPVFDLSDAQAIGVVQNAAQAISEVIFPPDAIRVTPIALFRKLLPLPSLVPK